MEKRVERNKDLYKQIEANYKAHMDSLKNQTYDITNKTLSGINPELFGDSTFDNNKKKTGKKWIYILIPCLLVIVGVILWIIL